MLREEKKVVIKAISDLGHRVTAADVASKTGLSLTDTTTMLNTIASEVGGHLEVSQAGDIAYRFKNNFQSAYLATGIRAFLAMVLARLFDTAFFLIKISFGVFLCLSLFIVVTCFIIVAVLSSQFGSQRRDLNLGELLEFFNLLIFRDLIFWGTASEQRKLQNQAKTTEQIEGTANNRGNFFVNCFSYLFGDGNPNQHIDEHKWQLAAKAIRENGGVVIKEQLAPYIGPELDDTDSILPVLTRFDGRPAVTSKGNIAYIFPSLQVTTDIEHQSNREDIASAPARQGYLKEERWKFSNLSIDALKRVYVVACLNLFGTLWMFFIFNHLFRFKWLWTEVMVAYGAMFVIIPIVRLGWQAMLNHRINIRNYERQESAKIVTEPNGEIQAKLAEREEFAPSVQVRAVEEGQLAFTTERESLEQQFADLSGGEATNLKRQADLNQDPTPGTDEQ